MIGKLAERLASTLAAVPAHPTLQELAAGYSPVKRRTVDVSLGLFATHGVGGTSLQMIADELGVTKAAVYHQFPTKDAIVLAVVEVQTAPLEAAVATADGTDEILPALVDAVVAHRRTLSILQGDPVIFRVLAEHPPSRRFWDRLFRSLLGDDLDDRDRIRVSAISALLGTVGYPLVQNVDDDTLRQGLTEIVAKVMA
jgi:AcrR family transcriptional regulator